MFGGGLGAVGNWKTEAPGSAQEFFRVALCVYPCLLPYDMILTVTFQNALPSILGELLEGKDHSSFIILEKSEF